MARKYNERPLNQNPGPGQYRAKSCIDKTHFKTFPKAEKDNPLVVKD